MGFKNAIGEGINFSGMKNTEKFSKILSFAL